MEKRKSTGLLLSILGVISLVLITAGVTYAFFSYTKEGTKTNTIQTGAITFRYDEQQGDGFTLDNALPMSDTNGITQTTRQTDPIAFNFSVTSTTPSTATIPYVVTVRDVTTGNQKLPTDQVKIYLIDNDSTGSNKTVVSDVVQTFSQLPTSATVATHNFYNTDGAARGVTNDRIIFEGIVPANTPATGNNAYSKDFTLGMWLKLADTGMADYSAYEFIKTSALSGSNAATVSSLKTGGNILTSTEYYEGINASQNPLTASQWTRIAYVNYTTGEVIGVSQNVASVDVPSGFTASEQYYPLNEKSFSVRVNVYAEGATTYTN